MPDINDKFVIYYAVRGYRTGQTVSIDIYDTVASKEVDSGTMTEMGATGIYYYNFFPRKRTSYLAVMDCATYPKQSHQVIRVEKTKLAGAVSIPKIAFPPKTWSLKEKERIISLIKGISKKQSELGEDTASDSLKVLNELASSALSLNSKMDEVVNYSSASKRDSSELMEKGLEEIESSKNSFLRDEASLIDNKFETLKKNISSEINKLSKFSIFAQLEQFNEKITSLSLLTDETNANLKLSADVFSEDIREKISRLSSQTDELIILLKNASN